MCSSQAPSPPCSPGHLSHGVGRHWGGLSSLLFSATTSGLRSQYAFSGEFSLFAEFGAVCRWGPAPSHGGRIKQAGGPESGTGGCCFLRLRKPRVHPAYLLPPSTSITPCPPFMWLELESNMAVTCLQPYVLASCSYCPMSCISRPCSLSLSAGLRELTLSSAEFPVFIGSLAAVGGFTLLVGEVLLRFKVLNILLA